MDTISKKKLNFKVDPNHDTTWNLDHEFKMSYTLIILEQGGSD